MRRLLCLVFVLNIFLLYFPENSYGNEPASKIELDWDYLGPYRNDRDLDTASLHILKKISEKKGRSVYRGITITRPRGTVTLDGEVRPQESSAVGVGPVYLIRNEKFHSGKLSAAVDMSGGLIVYDKTFPAGGKNYNFMWRVGPQLIYKCNENTSFNIGYMGMHVSNGFRTHNPGYNAHGLSVGLTAKF